MTRKQIQIQIAQFTGDWKDAPRKAKIFAENIYIPDVKSISLSYGYKTLHGERVVNHDTLNFFYTWKDGTRDHFGILD